MASPLKDIAIKCALDNNWEQAAETNLQILAENPKDLDSLNRLGFAYIQLNKSEQAKETFQKVLVLDSTNPIALKNIKKIESMSSQTNGDANSGKTFERNINDLYIEEAGKTRTVELKNLADKKMLSTLQPGEHVYLVPKRSKIFVQNYEKKYIGVLPDNIGMRLTTFIQGGNEYKSCVKSVTDKSVVVFIKETKKVAKFKNQPSFTLIPTASTRSLRVR